MIELLGTIGGILAVIAYFIGRRHGFEAGREHTLDQMAQRHYMRSKQ